MTNGVGRSRILIVALIAPLAVCIAGIVLMLVALPSLPDAVAFHWGVDGRPDAFGPPFVMPLVLAVIGIPAILIVGGIVLSEKPGHTFTSVMKLLAITPLWVALVLTIGFAGSLLAQRGVVGSDAAPSPIGPLAWALGVATVAGAVAWFLLPRSVSPVESTTTVPALPLSPGERVAWIGGASAPAKVLIPLSAVVVLSAVAASVAILLTGGRLWAVVLAPVAVLVLVVSTVAWRIQVDARGLVVRSIVGIPRLTVALADIEEAHVETVDPLGQFGGWGWRWGAGGRTGLILRGGDALAVTRRSGRTIVVTVDGAESAAALLNGLVARAMV